MGRDHSRRFSVNEKAKMIELRLEGKSVASIARKLGASTSTVWRILRQKGAIHFRQLTFRFPEREEKDHSNLACRLQTAHDLCDRQVKALCDNLDGSETRLFLARLDIM